MDTERNRIKLRFPLWPYLKQPVFSPKFKSLNPIRFWQLHNTEQLESCWTKAAPEPQWIGNPIKFLEDCWFRTGDSIELTQDPEAIQYLEGCWNRDLPPEGSVEPAKEYLDESEEYR